MTNWNYPNRCGDLDQMLTYIIHKPGRQATVADRGPQSISMSIFMLFINFWKSSWHVVGECLNTLVFYSNANDQGLTTAKNEKVHSLHVSALKFMGSVCQFPIKLFI